MFSLLRNCFIGLLVLLSFQNSLSAQISSIYANKDPLKPVKYGTRLLDQLLFVGVAKNEASILIIDLKSQNVRKEVKLSDNGLGKVEGLYVYETYFLVHDKKGALAKYSIPEGAFVWKYNQYNVVDFANFEAVVALDIKSKETKDNLVILDNGTGAVISQLSIEKDDKEGKYEFIARKGDLVFEVKKKGQLASAVVGNVELRFRNVRTNSIEKTLTVRGIAWYTYAYSNDSRAFLAMYHDSKIGMNGGSNLKLWSIDWETFAIAAETPLTPLMQGNMESGSFSAPIFFDEQNNLMVAGGIDFLSATDLTTGKEIWTAPFSYKADRSMFGEKRKVVFVPKTTANGGIIYADHKAKGGVQIIHADPRVQKVSWSVSSSKKKEFATDLALNADKSQALVLYNGMIIKASSKASNYVMVNPTSVQLIDVASGSVKWEVDLKGAYEVFWMNGKPVVATEKEILSLDPETGKTTGSGKYGFDKDFGSIYANDAYMWIYGKGKYSLLEMK